LILTFSLSGCAEKSAKLVSKPAKPVFAKKKEKEKNS
jgi:hypothetical protein